MFKEAVVALGLTEFVQADVPKERNARQRTIELIRTYHQVDPAMRGVVASREYLSSLALEFVLLLNEWFQKALTDPHEERAAVRARQALKPFLMAPRFLLPTASPRQFYAWLDPRTWRVAHELDGIIAETRAWRVAVYCYVLGHAVKFMEVQDCAFRDTPATAPIALPYRRWVEARDRLELPQHPRPIIKP